ncbi:MAG: protein-disulfide reductase DsbD [Legionella sp.]|uniref:protein-disulfide reductase DsbD n=1 Tax=Legionella sp. TaxID=459 RepID=UPI00284C4D05|nr:protein-disulfide reductase DsbD [Legionella sp.]
MKKWLLFFICCFTTIIGYTAPLPPTQIFQVKVDLVDLNTFTVNFQIKAQHFLYSNSIKLEPEQNNIMQLGPLRLPPTLEKTDKRGQKYTVYRDKVSIPIAILGNKPGKTSLQLSYQGCSDDGFCYPPEEQKIKLVINDKLELSQVSLAETENKPATRPIQPKGGLSKIFESNNWAMILITFYGLGLLLSFTPCILPMVPVLSGIIIGHGKEITTRKAFFLSLSYVLSMSITYAIVGAVVALLGSNLQISMQSPWSIGFLSIIFVLLALSMFGFYEFKLPNSWQAKIGSTSRSQRGGHYLGAAIMGCLSTLILSPCVTAPLIGVLTYIAQTKNVLLGCLTLLVLGLGMGTPLLLIGTSAGKWLPETGGWMNTIKASFGVLFIAVAILLISRIAPAVVSMALWAILLIFSGIYCGALAHSSSNQEKFSQSVGIILLVYGILILIGSSMGATNPLQPLTVSQAASAIPPKVVPHEELTLNQIKQKIIAARGKPIMLDFYADWCTACKVMDATTFQDPHVQTALEQFVVLKVDVTANSANDKKILNYFNVIAPPTFMFFDAKGMQHDESLVVGEVSTDEFLAKLNQVVQGQE